LGQGCFEDRKIKLPLHCNETNVTGRKQAVAAFFSIHYKTKAGYHNPAFVY
jgi:hypothetical protein